MRNVGVRLSFSPEMTMGRSRGFTLVELMVVVAVLSLLLTILAPSLRRSVLLAESAVCQSNLHQL